MKHLFLLWLVVTGCCIFPVRLSAASNEKASDIPAPAATRGAYMEALTLSPESKPLVRKNMQQRLAQLQQRFPGQVVALRDSVVAGVVLPSADVFCSNDTLLSDRGVELLKRVAKLFPDAGNFHIVVAVHTANTGTEARIERFSSQRAQAVARTLEQILGNTAVVAPFGMGAAEPLARNSTYRGREENRRVEIWFIPVTSWAERLTSR